MRACGAAGLALPVLLAAALIAADAVKPPLIDDTAYLALARQIAHHPLDPYGFEQFWYSEPEPANHVLAPPVLPYWLALGIRIVGEQPWLLKVWLFPIALLFVFAMRALLKRFARSMAEPMLVLAVFSPAVLPALNLMIDLPSIAFSLSALEIFFAPGPALLASDHRGRAAHRAGHANQIHRLSHAAIADGRERLASAHLARVAGRRHRRGTIRGMGNICLVEVR